jgi:hypothetical protein
MSASDNYAKLADPTIADALKYTERELHAIFTQTAAHGEIDMECIAATRELWRSAARPETD